MNTSDLISRWSLEITQPWMLWFLILLVPIAWYYVKSLSDFPKWQRRFSLLSRVVILVLLVLAIAGLSLLSPTTRQYIAVAIDRSLSVDTKAQETIDEFVAELERNRGDSQIVYLQVASNPSALVSSYEQLVAPDEKERRGSDLAAAIQTAAAAAPPGFVPQIVMLTDGRQTRGDAIQAAAASKIPVSVIPLSVRTEPEVQVAEAIAPAEVRQGEPFYVETIISSNHEGEGFIDVFRGDILVSNSDKPIKIREGENRFRFRQSIEQESQTDYVIRVRGFKDTLLNNNAASAVVFAAGKPSVLIVDSNVQETSQLRWALEEQDLIVQVRPAEGLPRTLSELQKFDCVVLSNIPATIMSLQQMEILRTYVEDLGGGLVMIGGDQSFGLGGYYKTTLEEILPVRSNFDREKEKPSFAMVLVIDKSGSMGGDKIEMAKDAAKGAAELLGPKDQLGVIAFDGQSYWVSELHSAADKGYIIDRISTIEASGGTSIYPGLSDAYEALVSTSAKLKHVILLTDGHSAFTSDAKSQWAAEWLTWPNFGPFWAQVIRHCMRKSESKGVFVEVQRDGDRSRVIVDSVDPSGRFINQATTKMTVIAPKLERSNVDLEQIAPGRYQAEIQTDVTGAYHLELSQSVNNVPTFRQTRSIVVGYPDELRLGPADEDLMKKVAEVSGGKYCPTVMDLFASRDRVAQNVIPLWPYLLMGALSLFLVDVLLRRLDVSLWF